MFRAKELSLWSNRRASISQPISKNNFGRSSLRLTSNEHPFAFSASPFRRFSTDNTNEHKPHQKPSLVQNTGIGLKVRLNYKVLSESYRELEKSVALRKVEGNPQRVVLLYDRFRQLITQIDGFRHQRKENAAAQNREQGKQIKQQLRALEIEKDSIEEDLIKEASHLPNLLHPNVPPTEPEIIRTVGQKPEFGFGFKPFEQIIRDLDLVDFESAAIASGSKFYYLKNELALMELALIQWSMQKLVAKGWTPILTPDVVRHDIANGCGFQPRGLASQTYSIEDHDLCLAATAEIPLAGLYTSQIIPVEKLPIKLVGFSHAFRTELGHGSVESTSLYRVHQFSKVEMFAFCVPAMSDLLHEEMLSIQEELYSELGLHFQVLEMPACDLGAPAYRKFDIEAWIPSQNRFGEISSTSNCTDYQSRRLNIRFKIPYQDNQFVHTVNGTACAVPRLLITILEKNQLPDGRVKIPEVLVPFMGGITHISFKN